MCGYQYCIVNSASFVFLFFRKGTDDCCAIVNYVVLDQNQGARVAPRFAPSHRYDLTPGAELKSNTTIRRFFLSRTATNMMGKIVKPQNERKVIRRSNIHTCIHIRASGKKKKGPFKREATFWR